MFYLFFIPSDAGDKDAFDGAFDVTGFRGEVFWLCEQSPPTYAEMWAENHVVCRRWSLDWEGGNVKYFLVGSDEGVVLDTKGI